MGQRSFPRDYSASAQRATSHRHPGKALAVSTPKQSIPGSTPKPTLIPEQHLGSAPPHHDPLIAHGSRPGGALTDAEVGVPCPGVVGEAGDQEGFVTDPHVPGAAPVGHLGPDGVRRVGDGVAGLGEGEPRHGLAVTWGGTGR